METTFDFGKSFIATFDGIVILEKGDNDVAYGNFIDGEDLHGIRFEKPVMCRWGKIMDSLSPVRGERFIIECFRDIDIQEKIVLFQFPARVKGVNNDKRYKYDFKCKRLMYDNHKD